METEVISDFSECARLWKIFRKDDHIWSDWEIVLSFFDPKIHIPYFIVLKEKNEEVGLIPLWLDKRDNKYTHFGGERMENRTFWINEEQLKHIPNILPDKTYLFDMNGDQVNKIVSNVPEMLKFKMDKDIRFFLDLEKTHNMDNFLLRFSKKHKKNLLRDIKMLDSINYKIIWNKKNQSDIMINLSKERFKEESDFFDEDNVNEMKSFMELLEKKGMLHSLCIEVNGLIEGMEVAAEYNNYYYVINGGFNPKIKNLGKLLILEHINNAMRIGAKQIDFLVGDTGWKDLWNLDKEECVSIINNMSKNEKKE